MQVNALVLLSVTVSGVCPSEPINSSHARLSNIVSVSDIHPSKLASENIPFSNKPFLIFLTSAFFLQKISIFIKISTFTQSNSVRAVLEVF